MMTNFQFVLLYFVYEASVPGAQNGLKRQL